MLFAVAVACVAQPTQIDYNTQIKNKPINLVNGSWVFPTPASFAAATFSGAVTFNGPTTYNGAVAITNPSLSVRKLTLLDSSPSQFTSGWFLTSQTGPIANNFVISDPSATPRFTWSLVQTGFFYNHAIFEPTATVDMGALAVAAGAGATVTCASCGVALNVTAATGANTAIKGTGVSANSVGVFGSNTNGYGGWFESTSGRALYANGLSQFHGASTFEDVVHLNGAVDSTATATFNGAVTVNGTLRATQGITSTQGIMSTSQGIVSTSTGDGVLVAAGNALFGEGILQLKSNGTTQRWDVKSAVSNQFVIKDNTAGVDRLSINGSGAVTIGGALTVGSCTGCGGSFTAGTGINITGSTITNAGALLTANTFTGAQTFQQGITSTAQGIVSTSTGDGILVAAGNALFGEGILQLKSNGTTQRWDVKSAVSNQFVIRDFNAGVDRLSINGSGAVTIGGALTVGSCTGCGGGGGTYTGGTGINITGTTITNTGALLTANTFTGAQTFQQGITSTAQGIVSTSTGDGILVAAGNAVFGEGILELKSNGTTQRWDVKSAVSNRFVVKDTTLGVDRFTIDNAGTARFTDTGGTCQIAFTSGGVTCPSDRRLKHNFKPMAPALAAVMQLKPTSYDWVKSGQHADGLIAQDVQKVFPLAVHEGEGKYLNISYQQLVPYLIKAIQEQQAEIEDLKRKIK